MFTTLLPMAERVLYEEASGSNQNKDWKTDRHMALIAFVH